MPSIALPNQSSCIPRKDIGSASRNQSPTRASIVIRPVICNQRALSFRQTPATNLSFPVGSNHIIRKPCLKLCQSAKYIPKAHKGGRNKNHRKRRENITVTCEDGDRITGYVCHLVEGYQCEGTHIGDWFIIQKGDYPTKYEYGVKETEEIFVEDL